MEPAPLSNLIQELIAIPATRWKKSIQEYDQHSPQEPQYIESYHLEHRDFRIYLDGYYGGVNSGTVKLNLFNGHNGRGLPLHTEDTLRKDILERAEKTPTALSELYAKVQENYSSQS